MTGGTEWPADWDPADFFKSAPGGDEPPLVDSFNAFGSEGAGDPEIELGSSPEGKPNKGEKPGTAALPFKLYADFGAARSKRWLVDRLLGVGEQSAWYGPPGSGKSVLVEDLCLHVAAGLPWFGRAVLKGAVLYLALERRDLVERRAIAFRLHHGIENLPFAVVGASIDVRVANTADAIIATVREVERATGLPVVLIVFDTLSRGLNGGDENSPKDMGAAVANAKRVQDATGAHVGLVHHTPIDAGERLRGHGVLLGAMDITLAVAKGAPNRTATVMKANDAEESQVIAFMLKSVVTGSDESGDTEAPVVALGADAPAASPREPRLSKNQQTMFSILHAAGSAGLITEEWNERARAAGLGVSRRADLFDFRSALQAKHLVRQSADLWTVVP